MVTMATASATPRPGRSTRITERSVALQRRMQLALGALRGVTLAWSAVVCTVDAESGVLSRPLTAVVLLAVLTAWSVVWTVAVGRRDRWIAGPAGIVVDLALACLAVAADALVYDGGHPQTFASAWPIVAVIATGIAAGPTAGLVGGVAIGTANMAATAAGSGIEGEWLATAGTTVLMGAAGWIGGWVAEQLRTTAQEAADAQARAEVARTLHDGVLQTLAVIRRRSDDTELVALAREQDDALRAYLRGDAHPGPGAFVDRLRDALAVVGGRHGVEATLVVIDPGTATGTAADALLGATGEAVVNAAKHAGVGAVWVSVDRREPRGTTVVVHDEGTGFDVTITPSGTGIRSSIHDRLRLVHGGATIDSVPGRGTDVTLWVP